MKVILKNGVKFRINSKAASLLTDQLMNIEKLDKLYIRLKPSGVTIKLADIVAVI